MQNLLRLWPLLLCSLFILPRCNKDADTLTGPATSNKDNCDVHVSYDAEITTVMKPVRAADANRLTVLDRALLLPQRERQRETFCMQADGSYTIETEILTPEHPIEYPENTVGVWPKPEYARSVNNNGLVRYYNAENEEINQALVGSNAVETFLLVEAFRTAQEYPLDADDDDIVDEFFTAMADQGYGITAQGEDIISFTRTRPDGSASLILINKAARMPVGQMDLDTEGYPIGGFLLRVSGQAPDVTLEQQVKFTFLQAVESKVELQRIISTTYHEFAIES